MTDSTKTFTAQQLEDLRAKAATQFTEELELFFDTKRLMDKDHKPTRGELECLKIMQTMLSGVMHYETVLMETLYRDELPADFQEKRLAALRDGAEAVKKACAVHDQLQGLLKQVA